MRDGGGGRDGGGRDGWERWWGERDGGEGGTPMTTYWECKKNNLVEQNNNCTVDCYVDA